MINYEQKPAKAGQLISIECGQYSDYGVVGFFVVLKEFCPIQKAADYLSTSKDKYIGQAGFLALLLSEGLLLEIDYACLHLGNYDDMKGLSFGQVS